MKNTLRVLMAILLLCESVPLPAVAAVAATTVAVADPGAKASPGEPADLSKWSGILINGKFYYCLTSACAPGAKIPPGGAALYSFTLDKANPKIIQRSWAPYRLYSEEGKLYAADSGKKKRLPIEGGSIRPVMDISVVALSKLKVELSGMTFQGPAKAKTGKGQSPVKDAKGQPPAKDAKDQPPAKDAKDQPPAKDAKDQPAPKPPTLDEAIAEAYPSFSAPGKAAAKCYLQGSEQEKDFIDKEKRKGIDLKKQEAEIKRLVGLRLTKPTDGDANKQYPVAEALDQCLAKIPGLLEHYCTSGAPADKNDSLDQRCAEWRFAKAYPDENDRAALLCVASPEEIGKIKETGEPNKGLNNVVAQHIQHVLLEKDVPKCTKVPKPDPKKLDCLKKIGKDKLKGLYCANEPDYDILETKSRTVREEAGKVNAETRAALTDGDAAGAAQSRMDQGAGDGVQAQQHPPVQQTLANECKAKLATKPRGGNDSGFKDRGVGNLTAGEDKRNTKNEEDEAKKKELMTNLKKDAVAGAFGAVGFGMLGFIFGGPIGALVGGLVGFGLMAGVTHLNNNPIK